MTPTTAEWVSGADQIAEQGKFGASGPVDGLLFGDANDDGQVTGSELASVQQNFDNLLAPSGSSVPEPASLALLCFCALFALKRPG